MMLLVQSLIQQLKATNRLVMKLNLLHILKQESKVKTIQLQNHVRLMVMSCTKKQMLQLHLVNLVTL